VIGGIGSCEVGMLEGICLELFKPEHLEYLNGFNTRAGHGERSRVQEKFHCFSKLGHRTCL
jgi:hypothetical protein